MTNELQKEIETLKKYFDDHVCTSEKRLSGMDSKLDTIKDNHLAHIQTSIANIELQFAKTIGSIEASLARTETNQQWMMKSYWIIATATVGALVASFFNLIAK